MIDCNKYESFFIDAIDMQLNEKELNELESHLAVCSDCRRLFDDMKIILSEEKSLDDAVPEDLHEQIMSAVFVRKRLDKLQKKMKMRGFIAAAIALIILGGAGVSSVIKSKMSKSADSSAMVMCDRAEMTESNDAGCYTIDEKDEMKSEFNDDMAYSRIYYANVSDKDAFLALTAGTTDTQYGEGYMLLSSDMEELMNTGVLTSVSEDETYEYMLSAEPYVLVILKN